MAFDYKATRNTQACSAMQILLQLKLRNDIRSAGLQLMEGIFKSAKIETCPSSDNPLKFWNSVYRKMDIGDNRKE
jgi:hypothetical protein